MLEYISQEYFNIKNRGTLFIVTNDKDRTRKELNELVGTTVLINDIEYVIKSIESYAIDLIKENSPIGLLV